MIELAAWFRTSGLLQIVPAKPGGPDLYLLTDNKGALSTRQADSESFNVYQKALSLRANLICHPLNATLPSFLSIAT